ncbi:hypothetical protein C808_02728 [Lachnospiraceae bacterium M18-1]|nr:hypothetical protein C808_02728 [Lachnospiraceae bacterium M18-1]
MIQHQFSNGRTKEEPDSNRRQKREDSGRSFRRRKQGMLNVQKGKKQMAETL